MAGLRFSFDLDGDGTYEIVNVAQSTQPLQIAQDGIRDVRMRVTDQDGDSNELLALQRPAVQSASDRGRTYPTNHTPTFAFSIAAAETSCRPWTNHLDAAIGSPSPLLAVVSGGEYTQSQVAHVDQKNARRIVVDRRRHAPTL